MTGRRVNKCWNCLRVIRIHQLCCEGRAAGVFSVSLALRKRIVSRQTDFCCVINKYDSEGSIPCVVEQEEGARQADVSKLEGMITEADSRGSREGAI